MGDLQAARVGGYGVNRSESRLDILNFRWRARRFTTFSAIKGPPFKRHVSAHDVLQRQNVLAGTYRGEENKIKPRPARMVRSSRRAAKAKASRSPLRPAVGWRYSAAGVEAPLITLGRTLSHSSM